MNNDNVVEIVYTNNWETNNKHIPQMSKSEQNIAWEEKRPEPVSYEYWDKIHGRGKYRTHEQKYNRKHTNELGSHNGESRNSRADKMSGCVDKEFKKYTKSGTKNFIKHFYTRKRRMFLKNENNWGKI